jgi:Icc-related predicted phosphoesterase
MKCWLISDTHGRHAELRIPTDVDVVIHCGDESESLQVARNEQQSRDFFRWFSALKIEHKIFVPGNHSTAIEHGLIRPQEYPTIRFLIHQQMQLGAFVVFGTPYTPRFFEWAFMRERKDLDAVWQSIPDRVDILISHGPPKGYLDRTRDMASHKRIHVGSQSLTRHVRERIKPRVHAFGHIHDEMGIKNFGTVLDGGILFVNCSCCDQSIQLENHGIVIEFDSTIGEVAVIDP